MRKQHNQPQPTARFVLVVNLPVTKRKPRLIDKLQELGYVVKTSLTKDVTILVNESGIESAKTKKARDAGVQIITNLLEFIGE